MIRSDSIQSNVVVVNISISGSRLGGGAIAAEWHSRFMARSYPIVLWRMWDQDHTHQVDGLPIRNFKTFPRFHSTVGKLPRKIQASFLTSTIVAELKKTQPAIVHLQNPGPPFEFERIAKLCNGYGGKVVASTHGFFEVFSPSYGLNFAERAMWNFLVRNPIHRSFNHIDAFVSGYPDEKQLLNDNGVQDDRIHLVPNGINPFFNDEPTALQVEETRRKFGLNLGERVLLYMGNHTANKGLDTVIRAAAKMDEPVTLVIGGRIKDHSLPGKWKEQLAAHQNVKLVVTDYLTLEEQRVLYRTATVLLFPSLSDTLPLTILEAMASGLPVIAYATGGIPFQLESESGVLVPKGDEDRFIAELKQLLLDSERQQRITANAIQRQQELFTWSSAANKTIQIYERLLANR